MSAGLKRGKITARIGKSEGHALPSKSSLADELNTQTEEKRLILQKLCQKYNSLKNDLSAQSSIVLDLSGQLSSVEKTAKELLDRQLSIDGGSTDAHLDRKQLRKEHQSRIEELEAEQKRRDHDRLQIDEHETRLQRLIDKKTGVFSQKTSLQSKLAELEKAKVEIADGFQKDERISKELSTYLSRLAKNVFEHQNKLEQLQIGTQSTSHDLRQFDKKLRDEKRKQLLIRQKMEKNMAHRERREGSLTKQPSPYPSIIPSDRQLEEIRWNIDQIEKEWLEIQDKISTLEPVLARERAIAETLAIRKKKYENGIRITAMQPTPSMYRGYVSRSSSKLPSVTKSSRSRSMETAEIQLPSRKPSIRSEMESIRQSLSERESRFLSSVGSDVPGMEEYEGWDEPMERDKERRKMIRSTENMAEGELQKEKDEIKRRVSGLAREAGKMEDAMKDMQRNMQTKRSECLSYQEKTMVVNAKTMELRLERADKETKIDELRKVKEKSSNDSVNKLLEQRSLLEHERSELLRDSRDRHIEETKLKHSVDMIISWRKSADRKELLALNEYRKEWQQKVGDGREELEELEKTLKQAKAANKMVRQELAVVKPYEDDAREYENLQEEERRLNRQLREYSNRRDAEKAEMEGGIEFQEI